MQEINPWPAILQKYVDQNEGTTSEYEPRRVQRKFHGIEVTLWQGYIHVDDIAGYVENLRLKFYLNRWRERRGDANLTPTTDEIYEIMLEADREEPADRKKPFHVDRMAHSIVRNSIQEPIIVYHDGHGSTNLWDGNRRFYGTKHIMREPAFESIRGQAQWIPAYVVSPAGNPEADRRLKHAILTEMNFVDKDHIPWPSYIKAEQISNQYERDMAIAPGDPVLSRQVKERLARDFGLKGWRQADRWIKMYQLARDFKEYQEEEKERETVEVDLSIQEKFEYFDELSKPGVWGRLKGDPDSRDLVFDWLWDGKFKAFPDVRMVPRILDNPAARVIASAPDLESVRRAIHRVIADDPVHIKTTEAANEKIKQFAEWLNSFKREDYKQLSASTLERLRDVLVDVVKMLGGLVEEEEESQNDR